MMIMDMHLHSNYSDGLNSIEEMAYAALNIGFTHIAFTDHVWKNSPWIDDYINSIKKLQIKYKNKLRIYSGVESKVIDRNGNIDFDYSKFSKLDYVLAAFHRIPLGHNKYLKRNELLLSPSFAIKTWVEEYKSALKNPFVSTMAHPFAIFKENNIKIKSSIIQDIISDTAKRGKIFEINIKRDIPDKETLNLIKKYKPKILIGSDSHSTDEIIKSKDKIFYWNTIFKSNI